MDARQLWHAALGELQLQLPTNTYETWMSKSGGVSYEDGVLVVSVDSAYARDWLENRLYGVIQRTVTGIANRSVDIRFVVQRIGLGQREPLQLLEAYRASDQSIGQELSRPESSRVNTRYTFENFIVGQSNRLAQAGCLAVAESPGMAYNPLFIYGGVGLGKTHLLHAIHNRVSRDDRKSLYVSAEHFTNDLINSIRKQTTEEFRATYRMVDVLLLDDVQFLVDKEATQEEFFHTFDDLYQENRQIVLSSDRPPNAFVGFEERLRSRFGWGLIADIRPPDLETRMAILVAKVDVLGMHLPDEVIEFIAQQIHSNIRELEGALTRVLALARSMGHPLTVQTAERALSDMMRPPREVTIEEINAVVSAYHGLRVSDLTGRSRVRNVVTARHVAMYLARELAGMSLPQIGRALGGRDHTTVMHGYNKIAALFEKDDNLQRQIQEIKTKLYGSSQRSRWPHADRNGERGSTGTA